MTPTLGFVIVTYKDAPQLLHLCERLNAMFGDPPIAVHHDFSQATLNTKLFPCNIHFVEHWIRTGWGSMTVVDAQLAAIRLLYQIADPQWFVNLSSVDYPIQTADQILSDLNVSGIDAFFDLRPITDLGQRYINEGLGELAFHHPRYSQGAFNRYVAIPLMSPGFAKKIRQPNEAWVWKSKFLIRHLTPFGKSIQCFGGDFWFTANRRVAEFLLDETPLWKELHHHFRPRGIPEEAFFHTLLGNTPGYNVCPDNLRYTDWKGCYAHPRTLGSTDFSRLLQSTHHFARKFPFDRGLLHELDQAVAMKETNAVTRTGSRPVSTATAKEHEVSAPMC